MVFYGNLSFQTPRFEMSYPLRPHLINQGYQFKNYADVYHPVSSDGVAPEINDPVPYRAEDSDTAFLTDRFLAKLLAYRDQDWSSTVAC